MNAGIPTVTIKQLYICILYIFGQGLEKVRDKKKLQCEMGITALTWERTKWL